MGDVKSTHIRNDSDKMMEIGHTIDHTSFKPKGRSVRIDKDHLDPDFLTLMDRKQRDDTDDFYRKKKNSEAYHSAYA